MKLLVTGALRITPEESAELEKLGYEIYFMPDERVAVPDNIPCEEIEAIICNGLFLYTPPDKFPKLRTVQLTSAGLDRVPVDYMDAHGIKVFNARGVYSAPMAEFAVCSVLEFYKRSAFFSAAQSEHRWEKHRGLEELGGKRVVIVGAGSVGRACADRFRAFGCEIIGVDRKTTVDGFDKIYSISDIRAAVSAGDIVIFCLPLTKETEHIANAELLCAMKDGAVIVNISRGGIIDTDALITELKSGRLRAALDVFEQEPLDADSELWDLPNAVITPHNSFVGDGNRARLFSLIISLSLIHISEPYRLTNDYFTAEDLTQETFLSAYSSLDRFDGRNERAWLSRIATNKCLDHLKSAASRTTPAEDDELEFRAGASPGLEDEYMNTQLGRDVRAACEALREPYRSVAVEYFCEDMPLSQIAERTGEPLKTVQTRAYRAKKMLRENLKEVILQ